MVTQYDSKNVNIVVGGVYLTGFAEDNLVSVEKMEDNSTYSVGAQGDVVQNVVNNPLGTITVTLAQTSPQVPYLNDLANRATQVEVWVNDKNTNGSVAGGTKCVVNKPAVAEYGAEVGSREFVITAMDFVIK